MLTLLALRSRFDSNFGHVVPSLTDLTEAVSGRLFDGVLRSVQMQLRSPPGPEPDEIPHRTLVGSSGLNLGHLRL